MKLFRAILWIACTTGLLYQSIVLLIDYTKYKTVVSIEQKHIGQNLPGITICYDHFLSLERIKQINHTLSHLFNLYLEQIAKEGQK